MIHHLVWICAALFCPLLWAAADRPQMEASGAQDHTEERYLSWPGANWNPPGRVELASTPDFLVATDGTGTHTSIQAAIQALPASGRHHFIAVKTGVYRETVCARGKVSFTLYGLGVSPKEVRLVDNRYAGQSVSERLPNPCVPLSGPLVGTAGSATAVFEGNDITLYNLTIANDAMDQVFQGRGYPTGSGESGGAQGVAVTLQGDRLHLQQVELWGHQDTLFVRRASDASEAQPQRVLFEDGLIAGDVDFIFGDATLVVRRSLVLSRAGRRTPPNGGHILAPSTPPGVPRGFLVSRSWLLAEDGLQSRSHSLGRAWDYGVPPGGYQPGQSPNGQALIRDSMLGHHVRPWQASTSRRPFTTEGPLANRFFEFSNEATLGRERDLLPSFGGWGSTGSVTGGSMASAQNVFDVWNREELLAALARPGADPRLIRVFQNIRMDTDSTGRSLTEEDFRDPAFDWTAYETAYGPARWGKDRPSGPMEDARRRSGARQARHIIARIPSNTSIVGMASSAGVSGGGLSIDQAENIVVRGLRLSQARDAFPQWDPSDGEKGEWNAQYDNLSLRQARRIWINQNTFTNAVSQENPVQRLGRPVEHYDGLLDITHRSDLVTVSWNRFEDHRKTTLIGGSDKANDAGVLRVTFHHNHWLDVGSRAPRVRYGLVHVYNNLYTITERGLAEFDYSVGVGVGANVLLQSNLWRVPPGLRASRILKGWGGRQVRDEGTLVNGQPTNLVEALARDKRGLMEPGAAFTPPYRFSLESTERLEEDITKGAGRPLN